MFVFTKVSKRSNDAVFEHVITLILSLYTYSSAVGYAKSGFQDIKIKLNTGA